MTGNRIFIRATPHESGCVIITLATALESFVPQRNINSLKLINSDASSIVKEWTQKQTPGFIIVLGNLPLCQGLTTAAILAFYTYAEEHSHEVRIAHCTAYAREVLELQGIDNFCPISETTEDAVAALTSS